MLLDSGADILIYGMGEHAIVEIADALDAGLPVDQITYINGTVYRTSSLDESTTTTCCPAGTTLPPTSSTTRAALTCSSRTWTPSLDTAW